MTDGQVQRMEELGVKWEKDDAWDVSFAALKRYRDGEGRGDPNCPHNYITTDMPPIKLGIWLGNQRQAKKGICKNKISDERIRQLEEIGVTWEKLDIWEVKFAALKRYRDSEGKGDPNCPSGYVTNDERQYKLGQWLADQRRAKNGKRNYKISAEQIRRLEDLGVRMKTKIYLKKKT